MVLLLIKKSYMLIVCSSKKELVGQEGLFFPFVYVCMMVYVFSVCACV